jgi:hypothetical protein
VIRKAICVLAALSAVLTVQCAAGATTSGHGAPTVISTNGKGTCTSRYHTAFAWLSIDFPAGTVQSVDSITVSGNVGTNTPFYGPQAGTSTITDNGIFVPYRLNPCRGPSVGGTATLNWHGLDGVADSEVITYTPGSGWSAV